MNILFQGINTDKLVFLKQEKCFCCERFLSYDLAIVPSFIFSRYLIVR